MGTYLIFLTIFSNQSADDTITFKIYDASEDTTLDCLQTIVFEPDKNIGIATTPYVFLAS